MKKTPLLRPASDEGRCQRQVYKDTGKRVPSFPSIQFETDREGETVAA